MAAIEKAPPRGDGFDRIARISRTPLLRLQEIDVAAAGDVERMPARAHGAPRLARERLMTIANGAEKLGHDSKPSPAEKVARSAG
jgi:hypothetical protein